MSTLDSRLKRIEQRIEPPAHPLLDDPAVRQLADRLADASPIGELMQEAIARRDAAGLRKHLDWYEDLCRWIEGELADDSPDRDVFLREVEMGREFARIFLDDPSTSFAHYAARHPRFRAIMLGEEEW